MSDKNNLAPLLACPFCGCDELTANEWYVDDAEVDAVECSKCFAGAPLTIWNNRHADAAISSLD